MEDQLLACGQNLELLNLDKARVNSVWQPHVTTGASEGHSLLTRGSGSNPKDDTALLVGDMLKNAVDIRGEMNNCRCMRSSP